MPEGKGLQEGRGCSFNILELKECAIESDGAWGKNELQC